MSTFLRNTLILILLAAIEAAAGVYFISYGMKKDVEAAEAVLAEKRAELAAIRECNASFEQVETRLHAVRAIWKKLPKRLYRYEDTAVSFAYFNELAQAAGGRIEYNYTLSGRTEKNGLIESKYTLVGEAPFRSLYTFISLLEHQPPLYRIDEFNIRRAQNISRLKKSADPNSRVGFILMLTAYATAQDGLTGQDEPERCPFEAVSRNPFYPLVREELPPNENDLPDVRSARLLGLTQNTAFIRDDSGRFWYIGIGDAVYLGTLSKIDNESHSAVFMLNEGGIVRHIELTVFSQSSQKNTGIRYE